MQHKHFVFGLAAAMTLLVLGCAHRSGEAPPFDNGVYVARGICFGEGGCYRYWRASQPVALLERPDPASPVVASVASEEWVEAIDGQLRLAPLRGVVRQARETPPLAVGDIVYMLEPEGEGYYRFWHRGQTYGSAWADGDSDDPITWDARSEAPPSGAALGWWVQLRLENGKTGWVESPSAFECMGQLQGSVDCRE